MLIIEGPDNVGKTTAAKRIVELIAGLAKEDPGNWFPARYQHMSRPNESFDFGSHYVDQMSWYAVQDRFHLGGKIWHDNVFSDHSLRWVHSRLALFGSFTLVIRGEPEWYHNKVHNTDREEMFDPETLCKANIRYRELFLNGFADQLHEVSKDEVSVVGYPSDEYLLNIIYKWRDRIREARNIEFNLLHKQNGL